jgi:hypothetical protein
MRGGSIMVEQQPGIFWEVGNDVDAIEECTTMLDGGCPIPVAVAASLGDDLYPDMDAGAHLPRHQHHHRRRHHYDTFPHLTHT